MDSIITSSRHTLNVPSTIVGNNLPTISDTLRHVELIRLAEKERAHINLKIAPIITVVAENVISI